jgi:2-hydroxy-3-keto-5-methylthiopentenyl-1-phosphate phosphatase
MLSLSADEDIIIYVGEGYSDRCPVRFADVVFAKDDLLRHCQEENISYYAYRQFCDVEERLRQLLAGGDRKGGLRKRRQAELARREVFLGG